MDQDADGDGNGDVVVWYCLSGDADNPDSERGKVYKILRTMPAITTIFTVSEM